MFRISKKFVFSAAHQLHGLPDGHQCARMHGHNYEVELFLEGPTLDHVGFVRDYGDLARFKGWLDKTFDHRLINDTIPQPTAENMARRIYEYAAAIYHEVVAVRVSETNNTTAWYSPHSLPPMDSVLDVFETLADEPEGSPQRENLVLALRTLLLQTGVQWSTNTETRSE